MQFPTFYLFVTINVIKEFCMLCLSKSDKKWGSELKLVVSQGLDYGEKVFILGLNTNRFSE